MLCPPEKVSRRNCPRHEVLILQPAESFPTSWAIVQTEEEIAEAAAAYRSAFDSRLPPVTRAELDSMDRLRPVADSLRGDVS